MEKLVEIYKKIYNLDYEIKMGNLEAPTGILLLATQF